MGSVRARAPACVWQQAPPPQPSDSAPCRNECTEPSPKLSQASSTAERCKAKAGEEAQRLLTGSPWRHQGPCPAGGARSAPPLPLGLSALPAGTRSRCRAHSTLLMRGGRAMNQRSHGQAAQHSCSLVRAAQVDLAAPAAARACRPQARTPHLCPRAAALLPGSAGQLIPPHPPTPPPHPTPPPLPTPLPLFPFPSPAQRTRYQAGGPLHHSQDAAAVGVPQRKHQLGFSLHLVEQGGGH